MATDKMLAETDGAVGRITFNNPERHNAVSLEMWRAAKRILDDFARDDAIRVIVLAGAGGKAFVSGADISKFEDERATVEAVATYNADTARVYEALAAVAKPTIAMIEGYCIGGGLALAVCCDLRLCADNARFSLPAARLGLGYPLAGLRRLVDVVGIGFAKEICFTARRFDAAAAAAMGLVNRVAPADELDALVRETAETIAANAPLTVKAMKRVLGEIAKDAADRDHAACDALVAECFASEDYVEGRRAFVEKRKPVFTGR